MSPSESAQSQNFDARIRRLADLFRRLGQIQVAMLLSDQASQLLHDQAPQASQVPQTRLTAARQASQLPQPRLTAARLSRLPQSRSSREQVSNARITNHFSRLRSEREAPPLSATERRDYGFSVEEPTAPLLAPELESTAPSSWWNRKGFGFSLPRFSLPKIPKAMLSDLGLPEGFECGFQLGISIGVPLLVAVVIRGIARTICSAIDTIYTLYIHGLWPALFIALVVYFSTSCIVTVALELLFPLFTPIGIFNENDKLQRTD